MKMILMTIDMELMMMITMIVRIAKAKPDSFGRDFVSIVDWERREVDSSGHVRPLRRTARAAPPQRGLLSAPVAPHGEPQLLRHLGAETLSVVHRVLPTVPAELENGDHDGEGQAAQEDHEHPANVLDTERVGLGVLALVLHTVVIVTAPAAGRSSREGGRGFR